MKPPGKTTLFRMQRAAHIEAERIEISQDARIHDGLAKAPDPDMVERRDNFAGVVRLIDIIMSDKLLLERLQQRMAAAPVMAPAGQTANVDDVVFDAEITDDKSVAS
jgi:hypothetical protein